MQSQSFLRPFRPLPLALYRLRSLWMALGGVALLTLSSKIQMPLPPVPVTMQTYAVLLIGAAYGPRLGLLTIAAWLGGAIAGLPLLAGSGSGPGYFLGPTGGYLMSFPLACLLAAACAPHVPRRGRLGWLCLTMLAGHVLTLGIGAGWLANHLNWPRAIEAGVLPFIVGSLVKSILAAISCELLMRFRGHPSNEINSGEPS